MRYDFSWLYCGSCWLLFFVLFFIHLSFRLTLPGLSKSTKSEANEACKNSLQGEKCDLKSRINLPIREKMSLHSCVVIMIIKTLRIVSDDICPPHKSICFVFFLLNTYQSPRRCCIQIDKSILAGCPDGRANEHLRQKPIFIFLRLMFECSIIIHFE